MRNILKHARANVKITDETGTIIFEDHNLFVDSGRAFIANIFQGAVVFNPVALVCDLGSSSSTPSVDELDLVSYTSPLSIAMAPAYPIALSGEPTGVHFQFIFNNTGLGGDKIIKELGLFYRDSSDDPPRRGSSPATMVGTMLARLKTTYSSIVVGDTRTITIDWRIIF
jgi:hypothetical protein